MINVYKYEDLKEEDCRLKCLEDLDVYNNEILTKEYEEEDKYVMEVVKKEDVKNFIREYLEKVTKEMGVTIRLEINEYEDVFTVKMFSDNNPILIGKNGRTLMSIQNILHQSIYAKTGIHVNILLDASNYKEKKQKNIEYMAKKLAKEVVQTGIEIKMDSMNSYERHLVHDVLSNYRGVKTESEGEEPNRCVVIKPSK